MKRISVLTCILLLAVLITGCAGRGGEEAVAYSVGDAIVTDNAEWHYYIGESDPSPLEANGWTLPGYDDTDWLTAPGAFGAKNGELAAMGDFLPTTLLPMRSGGGETIPVYFFRYTFNLRDAATVPALLGEFFYDDAVIVYLNGASVFRGNLPEDGYETLLSFGAEADLDLPRTGSFTAGGALLKEGENVLAVELHQGAESSSDIYFGFTHLSVTNGAGALAPERLCLFTAGDAAVTARWYGDGGDMTLRYVINGEAYAPNAASVSAKVMPANGETRYSAAITGLSPGDVCTYWIERGGIQSDAYTFEAPGSDGFSFLLLGDAQITGNSSADELTRVLSAAPKSDFFIFPGDLADSSSKEEQYRSFLGAVSPASKPIAAVIGNHEGPQLFDLYFSQEGLPSSRRDYSFAYGGTLFICLDSNTGDASEHEAFLRERIAAGEWDWVIAVMHHSVFGSGEHAEEESTMVLRNDYAALFAAYDVDMVLSGHDHLYARTKLMEDMTAVESPSEAALSKLRGQTVYVSAGSSTGSKYYEEAQTDVTPFAVRSEYARATATRIVVTPESIELETYYTEDGESVDMMTLTHAPESAKPQSDEVFETLKTETLEREREYLLSAVLPNGAISTYTAAEGDNPVNPYFADYAAIALARLGAHDTVRAYLDWRIAHMNSAGEDVNGTACTIYDYNVVISSGEVVEEVSTDGYDSMDSYAASFLMLLREYYEATGDADYIKEHTAELTGSLDVIEAVFANELTLARLDYEVQYLMDNCEVYAALGAARELMFDVFTIGESIPDEAIKASVDKAMKLRASIGYGIEWRLWSDEGYYNFAASPSGTVQGFDIKVFYPDAVSQLSPIIFGVIDPGSARAAKLYADFSSAWEWQTLGHINSGATNHLWGMTGFAAALLGDTESLSGYIKSYNSAVGYTHAYPLYVGDSAWVVLACLT